MELRFAYPGRFQLWFYHVGHGQLLLRRTPSTELQTQVDILFKNVVFLSLGVWTDDLQVHEADTLEIPPELHRRLLGTRPFIIKSRSETDYVFAGAVFDHEWEGNFSDRSPLVPEWPPR